MEKEKAKVAAGKKQTDSPGKRFAQRLDVWRKSLASDLAMNNKNPGEEELNFVVQRTLDRLIFLRFCESRSAEPYGQLQKMVSKGDAYKNLLKLFRRTGERYHSELFDLEKDTVSAKLKFTDSVIRTLVDEWYAPACSFDFSVLPAEILAHGYEDFLGKVIRVTPSRRVKIEKKPGARKAGGVFYTPEYIVDYMIKNTLGKLIEGKTPEQIGKIKIVDPSCGSGCFLIGAFEYLQKYYIHWYTANGYTGKKVKDNPLTPQGTLTIGEKKRILLLTIYGVDLDAYAVGLTQLCLLLKCVEGDAEAEKNVLPDLSNNIRCGNSLVDTDFYRNETDTDLEQKINPFSWKKEFPGVFKQGGFDVIIGNPPYVTLQLGKKQESQQNRILAYYKNQYPHSFEYKINLYALFIERSLFLLNEKGLFSFIVPATFYNTISFKRTRKYMLESGTPAVIMDLRYKVFAGAEIGGSAIFIFSKEKKKKEVNRITVVSEDTFEASRVDVVGRKDLLTGTDYNFIQNKGANTIIEKIRSRKNSVPLGTITRIYQGIITGDNGKYLASKAINSKWKPIVKGRDIDRYSTTFNNVYVYYSPDDLWSNTDEKMFRVPAKIISRQTSDRLVATLDTERYFSLDSTHVIHLLTKDISLKYLLGVYNSRLINFLYQSKVQEEGRVFAQVKIVNLKPLPIKLIDRKNKAEVSMHDEIEKHVDLLLKLNEKLKSSTLPAKTEQIRRQIERSEESIDQLVYALYQLTPEEIKTIEAE